MQLSEARILGITKNDIQEIFEKTLRDFKQSKTRIIYLDASYLYNFHLDDFDIIKKFNILGRYDLNAVKEWHICLERWLDDQTVILGDKTIKPIQIERSFDRVVNEGLEALAGCLIGDDAATFNFRDIGDDASPALPSDTTLGNRIDVIDVFTTPEGGSLSRDGSTLYSIGNHAKTVATADIAECGIESTESQDTDTMLDHSVFPTPIHHDQNADAFGSTTVIYMCAS